MSDPWQRTERKALSSAVIFLNALDRTCGPVLSNGGPAPESNAGVERQRPGTLLLLVIPEIRTLKYLKERGKTTGEVFIFKILKNSYREGGEPGFTGGFPSSLCASAPRDTQDCFAH